MRTSGIEDDQIDAREVKIKVYGFRLNSGLLLALFGIFVVFWKRPVDDGYFGRCSGGFYGLLPPQF